ncbi:MAG: N-acetylmuramoyl-L-alanine amidase [Desulfobacterales bacterium]|nr:MAG: N-acetylmuramoyl-L-alanine amidase [Desulfobacterales bacterium]
MLLRRKYLVGFILLGCIGGVLRPSNTLGTTSKDLYFRAEACYRHLSQNAAKMKYRENWRRCIEKFQAVYRQDPKGPWAAAGLYMAGKLYQELYRWSKNKSDYHAALEHFGQIIEQFPRSQYRSKAESATRVIIESEDDDALAKVLKDLEKEEIRNTFDPVHESHPSTVKRSNLENSRAFVSGKLITVNDLRFWSNPNYTRVVIDTNRETSFTHHLLKKDPSLNKPQRLYVDLDHSQLGENIKKIIPINDDLLRNARAGQYRPDSVRVVVDIKSFATYKIFSLKDPFRIVIDVWGTAQTPLPAPDMTAESNARLPTGALAKQLALGVRRIVIDPGHGGRDFGAPGYLKRVYEKNVVLEIARKLTHKIQKELQCEVILTRNGDRYLTLEERTALANTRNADLFISIHTNASRNRRAYGIETYFLNLATDDEAIRVAARENATSTKNISDLQTILNDLMQNAKINESSRLAGYVQTAMIHHLNNKRYRRINNKGVKQAPFYVLLGAQMPAILIETSFISNPQECHRLVNPKYQDRLCEAIVLGVKNYIKDTNPTAFLEKPIQFNSSS